MPLASNVQTNYNVYQRVSATQSQLKGSTFVQTLVDEATQRLSNAHNAFCSGFLLQLCIFVSPSGATVCTATPSMSFQSPRLMSKTHRSRDGGKLARTVLLHPHQHTETRNAKKFALRMKRSRFKCGT